MTADDRIENARAAREARDATAGRGAGAPRRTESAIRRYLASESFREKRREDREQRDREPGPQSGS
jgi:hypothetical protein